MPIDKKNHPIYAQASTFVSKRVPPEHLEALQRERDVVLEKGVILFDAAKGATASLREIDKKFKDRSFWPDVEQKEGKQAFATDSIFYKLLDVAEYVRYADKMYTEQYGGAFAAEIISTASDIIVQTLKSIEKKTIRFAEKLDDREEVKKPKLDQPNTPNASVKTNFQQRLKGVTIGSTSRGASDD